MLGDWAKKIECNAMLLEIKIRGPQGIKRIETILDAFD